MPQVLLLIIEMSDYILLKTGKIYLWKILKTNMEHWLNVN